MTTALQWSWLGKNLEYLQHEHTVRNNSSGSLCKPLSIAQSRQSVLVLVSCKEVMLPFHGIA